MSESKDYAQHLFPFMINHVLPEFQSPIGFLRARACWCIDYFSDLNWEQEGDIEDVQAGSSSSNYIVKSQGKGSRTKRSQVKAKKTYLMNAGQVLSIVIQGLLNGLRDLLLPVQTAAACSLRSLIGVEEAKELLRPMVKQIIAEYFRIMEEVENESVFSALQSIVEEFGEDIIDIAPMMVVHLVRSFHTYSQEGKSNCASYWECCDWLAIRLYPAFIFLTQA
jgi:hypothetical protein